MQKFLQWQVIVLLAITVRFGNLAIVAIVAKDTIWAILYGLVAILALLATALLLFGV